MASNGTFHPPACTRAKQAFAARDRPPPRTTDDLRRLCRKVRLAVRAQVHAEPRVLAVDADAHHLVLGAHGGVLAEPHWRLRGRWAAGGGGCLSERAAREGWWVAAMDGARRAPRRPPSRSTRRPNRRPTVKRGAFERAVRLLDHHDVDRACHVGGEPVHRAEDGGAAQHHAANAALLLRLIDRGGGLR